jgi:tryptophan-rich sensory protein
MIPTRLRKWWLSKSGFAKTVTVLCAILILQIGVCFASPAEPAWFDALFHPRDYPDRLHFAFAAWQAFFCCVTALLLLGALLIWVTFTSSIDEHLPSIIRVEPNRSADTEEKSGDRND